MADKWREMPFSRAVTVNPLVQLTRGAQYPFVDMQAVNPGSRCAYASELRVFDGGGSRFAVGDTLMARITPCLENGKIARYFADDDSAAHGSTEFIVLRGRDGVTDTDYVYYLTKWDGVCGYAISQMTGTSGRQRVPTESLDHVTVPVPPIPEQRAIAHILGTLDEKIELNRRMNETLEAMARALFKSWFVDFDPVHAKSEGRDPGVPKSFAALFPDRLENSNLGKIPHGWKWLSLSEFAFLNPESWSKGTRPDSLRYVDLSNTKWGRIEYVTICASDEAPSRAQRVLRIGDTIVGTVRPGNGSYALVTEDELTGSTGFAVLRPRTQQFREFIYLAATAADNISALAHLADGGAYPAVRPEVVIATRAVRPKDELIAEFSRVASPLLSKVAQNDRESRTLTTLRDTLLPRLISGELQLKNAERFIGRTV